MLLNKTDYIKKMGDQLFDRNTYITIDKNLIK